MFNYLVDNPTNTFMIVWHLHIQQHGDGNSAHCTPMSLWYGASLDGSKTCKHNILRVFRMCHICIKDPDSTQTKTFYISFIITINY